MTITQTDIRQISTWFPASSGQITQPFDNVKAYGATGDGTTDDTAAIQAAITAGSGSTVIIPRPSTAYHLTAALTVPSNSRIQLDPGTRLEVPAGSTFPVFDIDGKTNVTISGAATIGKASGAALSGTAYGVWIRGNSTDVLIDGLTIDGFARGVNVAGGEGTVAGTCQRIILRGVTSKNSATSFGINVDDTDTLLIDTCYAMNNWLDGVKLRKMTKNVTVRDGAFTANGQSYLNPGAPGGGNAGDGLDAFAGGDTFLIMGGVYDSNNGNGLTIKDDTLTRDSPSVYGYVRNVQVIGVRCRFNNPGYGATFYRFPTGDTTVPEAAHATFVGGYYEGNKLDGLYIDARNVSVLGGTYRLNKRYGVQVELSALWVNLSGLNVIANSQDAAATYHGMYLRGKHIRVQGGIVLGVEADSIRTETDYTGLTKYHLRNIYVDGNADDVVIRDVAQAYSSASQGIRADNATTSAVIHQTGTGVPATVGVYGTVGSTWTQTDAATGAVLWIKTSSNSLSPLVGWTRVLAPKALGAQTVGTTQAAIAHGLGYTPSDVRITMSSAGTIWRSAASDATSVYLTADAAGRTCDLYVQ